VNLIADLILESSFIQLFLSLIDYLVDYLAADLITEVFLFNFFFNFLGLPFFNLFFKLKQLVFHYMN